MFSASHSHLSLVSTPPPRSQALARRRVSNCTQLDLSTLQNVWGFRGDQRVRRACACLFNWLRRCPECKARISHFGDDNLKQINERQNRCEWLVKGKWTVTSMEDRAYTEETGITIGDGPTQDV